MMTVFRNPRGQRAGSGLIIALGVLAMLTIMATTFVTLMRLDARLTRVNTDDLVVEMLAEGVALCSVIAGLDPAIHVGARVKPGHDDRREPTGAPTPASPIP